jgi:putative ABC transport system substrate-binding protein
MSLRRREFIAGLGGAAAWPLAARAQQGERMRRIGVLHPGDENDPAWKPRISMFTQALADLGWSDGRNVRMDLRWYGEDINRMRALSQELVSLQPDIIVTSGTPPARALQRETRTIPIIFAKVGDPVASGIVVKLNQPGGNITGRPLGRGALSHAPHAPTAAPTISSELQTPAAPRRLHRAELGTSLGRVTWDAPT